MPIRGSPNGLRHFIHTVLNPRHLAVTLGWNGWSPSIGNSGHHQSERVVTLPRCAHVIADRSTISGAPLCAASSERFATTLSTRASIPLVARSMGLAANRNRPWKTSGRTRYASSLPTSSAYTAAPADAAIEINAAQACPSTAAPLVRAASKSGDMRPLWAAECAARNLSSLSVPAAHKRWTAVFQLMQHMSVGSIRTGVSDKRRGGKEP